MIDTTQFNNKPIGIIGAMVEEIAGLKEKMTITETVERAGMTFYRGNLYGKELVLVCCGIGKVNAAACTQLLIVLFNVGCVINSGVAGTLHPDINQGDIVISTDAVQHDMDVTPLGDPLGCIPRMNITFFEANQTLIEITEQAASNLKLENVSVSRGRVASGDQFIAGGPIQDRIQEHFAPSAVEMEGAAIAHTSYLNDVPFVIIRSISDKADGGAELSYENFLVLAATNASLLLEEMIKCF